MIKVELLEEAGKAYFFFEASKQEEQDTLDRINQLLTGQLPKRGGYVLGAPNLTLKVEVNTNEPSS